MNLAAPEPRTDARLRATAATMRAVAALARRAGHGGSVLGGHVGLALDHDLVAHLAAGRSIVVVSATNGKTTTTNLLAAAMRAAGPVVTNAAGSNLRTGITSTLAEDLTVDRAALEVDEATLANLADDLRPRVVVLGNLSRDQLDRYGEVRIVAARWHAMLERLAAAGLEVDVVANADDPLVVWAARATPSVTWVGAGAEWTADAAICPECSATIAHGEGGWHCTGCDLGRPTPDVTLDDDVVTLHAPGGVVSVTLDLALPGAFNRANAALALAGAWRAGVDPGEAGAAMSATTEVAGRYRRVTRGAHDVRLLMAKNPAGWQSSLGILQAPPTPAVVAINARVADGHDPSWLWDVPFELLEGRTVVAAGDRALDLSVRLRYAGVEHTVAPGPALEAVDRCPDGPVDLVANYTAFADVLGAIR